MPQLVCCSGGSLPVPEPDSYGNCKIHEVQSDESCWSIANDQSSLFSVDDLEDFNKRTLGWGGGKNLQASTIICLSPGNPPLPKPIPNAMCGPVKPGTQAPPQRRQCSMGIQVNGQRIVKADGSTRRERIFVVSYSPTPRTPAQSFYGSHSALTSTPTCLFVSYRSAKRSCILQ